MPNSTDTTMGKRIASLRKEHGMTQAELADQMSVTDKAVSKWERDLACPDIQSLPRLAEILGISVDELMQINAGAKERRGESRNQAETPPVPQIISLLFKALTVAMGVAALVLSILKKLDVSSGFSLLGIGLACAGISLLRIKS